MNKAAADNSVYVAIAGEVVNQRSVLLRNFTPANTESEKCEDIKIE